MEIKEIEKIIEKGKKSEFQNCFQCKYFPKPNERMYIDVGWVWRVPNIKRLNFRCRYLGKRTSQCLKPFQTNYCMCFKLPEKEE